MKYKGHEIKKFDKRDPLVADGSYKAGYYVYRGHYGVGNFEGAYETLKEAKDSIDETPYQRWQRTYPKRNPQGRHIMKRSANPRKSAGSKWGVYCRGTLAYVSSAKPDCTKAKTKLKRAGFGVCTVKKVGPNPVSGKVPVVGWRETFKKASRAVAGHSKKNPSYDYKDPRFHLHPQEPPYRATLLKHGYTYSHKTPIKRIDGSEYSHFTFKHRDNRDVNVGTWVGSDGQSRWSASVSGSGYQKTGKGANTLAKYLTGRAKRLGLAKNPGPTRGISSRAVSGRMGRKLSQFSPSRKYGGRSAGIGTRAVVKGGRLRNPKKITYYWIAEGKMRTPGPDPIGYRKYGSMYRFTSRKEAEDTARIINGQEGRSGDDRVRVVIGTGTSPRKRNPARRRNAASVLRRRSNPVRRTTRSANPRKGYVVQVGNSVAWVGKLASDATKVIRKLMAAGFKSVKGFEAKLLGAKPGWRKQYVKAARKSNPSFGRGKVGSGSRFKSCVRTMKRRGVKSPAGLCASIGRRKYGAKKMGAMAAKGRRRSNPRGIPEGGQMQRYYRLESGMGGYLSATKKLSQARKLARAWALKHNYPVKIFKAERNNLKETRGELIATYKPVG